MTIHDLPTNKPTQKRIVCFNEAAKFLESYDRIIYPIFGDGNCLFRAFSHLIFEKEEYHQQIRNLLMDFIILNCDIFSKYCEARKRTLQEHVAHMKYDTVWGTDIEIRAAASYLKLPIFVSTQRSKSMEYYWEIFSPLTTKTFEGGEYFNNICHTRYLPSHLEICQ